MKVKKFSGADNHEAMMKVRAELGINAVILHQRRVKPKGIFGFLKKPIIEVVAAVEESVPQAATAQVLKPTQPRTPEDQLKSRVNTIPNTVKAVDDTLSKEIYEIKTMLSAVAKRVNQEGLPDVLKNNDNPELRLIYDALKAQEIEEEIMEYILKDLADSPDNQSVHYKFRDFINKYVMERTKKSGSKVIFFVGPTGVGKTTTIAKLAANYSLNEGKSVGLISADTYRIAAVEQLRTYCDILSLPIEVIYEAKEIHSAIDKLKGKDLILVDTAGRSHKNDLQIKELQYLLNEVEDKEIYLVVSCTSKNSDLREIVKTYEFIRDYKLILTKLDEATTYGTIINTAIHTQRPLSYITTGQSVPDDIEIISVDKIISLLLEGA